MGPLFLIHPHATNPPANMKPIIPIALVCLLAMASCQSADKEIKREAAAYLQSTTEYDIDEACLHCTPTTAASLRIIQQRMLPQLDSAYLRQSAEAQCRILSVDRPTDSTARVAFRKTSQLIDVTDTLLMVLRNGQWMAHVDFKIPPVLLQKRTEFHYDTSIHYTVADTIPANVRLRTPEIKR